MPLPHPTIIYPNGGESFQSTQMTIQWSNVPQTDSSAVYEVFYTDEFSANNEPDWKQIATLPSGALAYVWRFNSALRSNRCRVAIRTRNSKGERSPYSVSAGNFSIRRKKLIAPSVLSPVNNERYNKFVEIVTDDRSILGTYSQRSFYQFFYSSSSLQIPSTPIAQNVPIGTKSTIWTTYDLPPADDYVIQAYLSDDDGNVSDSVFIRNIKISHEGVFIVDTTPPVGAIVINNNDTFTRNRNVSLNLVSYDETTGVHSMQIIDGNTKSAPDAFSDVKSFTLSEGDDIKTVELLLQDFGANRNDEKIQRLFGVQVELNNTKIADIAIDKATGYAWAVTNGTGKYLYRIGAFPAQLSNFTNDPTAVETFRSSVYVATNSPNNVGEILNYDGAVMVSLKVFAESDSTVNAMQTYNSKMYIGLENGMVYSYDGLIFTLVDTLPNPVHSMFSDGNLLYLVQKNDFNLYIFDGSTFFATGE